MAASNLRVALMLCLNLFSSLSIVFVNKVTYGEMPLRNVFLAATVLFLYFHFIDCLQWLFYYSKFPSITLTLINFIGTSIGLYLCLAAGFFKRKSVAVRDVIPLSLSFCGFVVFTNLSLKFNTVGTYQVSRYNPSYSESLAFLVAESADNPSYYIFKLPMVSQNFLKVKTHARDGN